MEEIAVKRIYDEPVDSDGCRVLVDRLWPRGVSKEEAQLDDWYKELAPSDELRKWFDHDPEKWEEFEDRYRKELGNREDRCRELLEEPEAETLTLLYAAKDREHNNAVVLRDFLNDLRNRK